jgi:hypothetical protein
MYLSFAAILVGLVVICSATPADISVGTFSLSQEQLDRVRSGSESDITELVDSVFPLVRSIIRVVPELYPSIALPNATIEFSEVIVGIPFEGVVGLYNGALSGIDTLHRTGRIMFAQETNGDITLDANAAFFDVALEYSFVVEFFGIGVRATLHGELTKFNINAGLRLADGPKFKLEKLDVTDTGFLRLRVTGLGFILNFIADLIGNVIGNMIKDTVVELIEGPILDLINGIIGGIVPYDEIVTQAKSNEFIAGRNFPTHHVVRLETLVPKY